MKCRSNREASHSGYQTDPFQQDVAMQHGQLAQHRRAAARPPANGGQGPSSLGALAPGSGGKCRAGGDC